MPNDSAGFRDLQIAYSSENWLSCIRICEVALTECPQQTLRDRLDYAKVLLPVVLRLPPGNEAIAHCNRAVELCAPLLDATASDVFAHDRVKLAMTLCTVSWHQLQLQLWNASERMAKYVELDLQAAGRDPAEGDSQLAKLADCRVMAALTHLMTSMAHDADSEFRQRSTDLAAQSLACYSQLGLTESADRLLTYISGLEPSVLRERAGYQVQ